MELEIISQNVKRFRAMNGMSQSALADFSGISLAAIKKLEGGRNEPRVDTLRAISKALGVKLPELLQPAQTLKTVRFRSNKRMRNREKIIDRVARWLRDFNYIEDLLNDQVVEFRLFDIVDRHSIEDPIEVATKCRWRLGLKPTEPIHDICGFLENAGIKLLSFPYASKRFLRLMCRHWMTVARPWWSMYGKSCR